MRVLLGVLVALVIAGCASKGFNRGAIESQLGTTKPAFDDQQIKEAYNKKPNLPKPFRLAIYFKTPKTSSQTPDWRWTEQDKNTFDQIAAQLKGQGLVAETFPILSDLVASEDLKSLRLAAAKQGADALLVVSGATQFDKYLNGWGATYVLLAPALFVPGSEVDTLFVSSAALWDVKNEYLYFASEAEATTNNRYVAAFGKRDIELVNEAKTKALEKLRDQIKASLDGKKIQTGSTPRPTVTHFSLPRR